MLDLDYTRCPGCKTIFRVTAQQLALRGGQVRCGHCKNVFDGVAARVSLAARPVAGAAFHDETRFGPPTVTLRPEYALEDAPGPSGSRAVTAGTGPDTGTGTGDAAPGATLDTLAPVADAVDGNTPADAESAAAGADRGDAAGADAAGDDPAPAVAIDYNDRFSSAQRSRFPGALEKLYPVALPLLLLALIGQAAFHFRDALAAHVPAIKPALVRICQVVGCAVDPLRDSAGLSIDASDLQADPAHRGLLMLTATLRNRAGWPVAYPYLELTLTDAQDQVVVRRALAPTDYARGNADVAAGIAANGEIPVQLFIDASATTQAGYRLYAFYP
jgi:predicted Zn finger-like uncharacterized protein